jgi:hypothetical protein
MTYTRIQHSFGYYRYSRIWLGVTSQDIAAVRLYRGLAEAQGVGLEMRLPWNYFNLQSLPVSAKKAVYNAVFSVTVDLI